MHFAKPSFLIGALFAASLALVCAAAPARAADTVRTVVSGGIKREYILHIPKGAPEGPKPLVIALHGALQPAGMMQRYLDLDAVADREGFVVAYPKGLNLLWNDGRSSIAGFLPLLHRRDDGRFVLDVLDRLAAEGIADPGRAYLMGFSNGGFLTAFVACRYAERFAAYAALMMTVPVGYAQSCKPSKPVPILLMNGTYDPIVPMFGRPTPGARLMSASSTASLFARLDGCAAPQQTSAPHARIWRWERCAPGAAVAYYEIAGGHQPPSQSTGAVDALASVLLGPRRSGLDAPQEIWAFFKRFGAPRSAPDRAPEAAEPLVAATPAPSVAPMASPPTTALAMAPTPTPAADTAPILRNPDSPATAWQGIAPQDGGEPAGNGQAVSHTSAVSRVATAVPLPPPSPLRERTAIPR